MSVVGATAARLPFRPLLGAAFLLIFEFLVIGFVYKFGINFDCRANWGNAACGTASKSLAALYCVIAAIGLFALLRPSLFRGLLAETGHDARALGLNLAGFGLAMIPVLFLREGDGARMMPLAFLLWVPGMALLLTGLLGWLAPVARWRVFLREAGPTLSVVVVAGALAPALAARLQPIWRIELIADATFSAVTGMIRVLGYDVIADPVRKHIGSQDFLIAVAPACSGLEGIALVTIFVSLYLWLFRQDLRFPRALLLYPMGIAASALLNVVRIAALLIIGLEGHPQLAVGGFHSHAGWVMFTLVALGIIAVAQKLPWLHRQSAQPVASRPLPPLRQDPVAARILPFAIFMLTAVVAPAISQNPAMFYPIRVLLLGAVIWLVWPELRKLPWAVSPLSWGIGAAIGVMWVAIPVVPSEGPPPYGALGGGLVILWFVFRGIGTVLLVPLVEELFFRDYLASRIRGAELGAAASRGRCLLASLVTAGLFAALHDRWIEALVAGLAFSYVAGRAGRISDAIAAHALANLIVFAVAVATGNLAMI